MMGRQGQPPVLIDKVLAHNSHDIAVNFRITHVLDLLELKLDPFSVDLIKTSVSSGERR